MKTPSPFLLPPTLQLVLPPLSEHRVVDFGAGLGMKSVYLYPLPEVASTHRYLRVPSVSARFGTDPFFWNWAMLALARLAPKLLADRRAPPGPWASAAAPRCTSPGRNDRSAAIYYLVLRNCS